MCSPLTEILKDQWVMGAFLLTTGLIFHLFGVNVLRFLFFSYHAYLMIDK